MGDGNDDVLSRLSAALWARVGRALAPGELGWARNLWDEERRKFCGVFWRRWAQAKIVLERDPSDPHYLDGDGDGVVATVRHEAYA